MTTFPAATPPRGRAYTVARIVWEALLLVGAAVLLVLVIRDLSGRTSVVPALLTQIALLGLPAAAIALSLRTATPNFAVGVIAGAAGLLVAKLAGHGWSFWAAGGVAVGVALVVGLVGGAVVGLLDVSGWVVSIALIAGLGAVILAQTDGGLVTGLPDGFLPHDPNTAFDVIGAVFIAGSIGGGLLWLLPSLRWAFGGDRPPGVRAPLGARLLGALVGFGGASAVAAFAGLAQLIELRASSAATSLALPLLPLGAALLGGASVHGRRGGIAGTVLATCILVGVQELLIRHLAKAWLVAYLPAAVAITIGLAVSALFAVLEGNPSGPAAPAGYPATGLPYPTGPSGYATSYSSFGGSPATVVDERDSTDALPTLEQ